MNKVEYFSLEESPVRPGKYIIRINFENFPTKLSTTGSFNILPARILNLTYAQYLRFCRDLVGGEIVGKNKIYPIPYFSKTIETNALLRLLNSRMNLIIWEKEHPDWREHAEYLEQKKGLKGGSNVFNS